MSFKVPATATSPSAPVDLEVDKPVSSIVQGAVGSLMMLFGSLGVGWLASVSDLRRIPLVIWLRLEPAGVVISVLALALGGMLLVRSWLRLGQKTKVWGPSSRRYTLAAVAAWGAPMFLAIPLFSRDVYAYIAQGKMMVNNLNPYEVGYAQLSNYLQTGADDLWAQNATPYGPVFLWIEEFVVWVTGGHPEWSIFLFRIAALIGVLLCIYCVPKLAQLHGINPHRALWLTAANPLFLTNFIASVHNDALMIGLALLGLYLAMVKRPLWGILLLTLSVGIKPITLVFLPFIGLLWAGRNAGWGRKFQYWAMTAGISLGLLALMGFINGFGFGWVGALSTPGSVWIWYAPIGFIGMIAGSLGSGLGLNGALLTDIVHKAGTLSAVGIILWQMFRGEHGRIVRRLTWSFAAIVFLAPMIQSWYIVWLIPLFAATGIRDDWQVKALYFIVSFLMVYAISDQLDIFPYIAIDLAMARNIAAVVAVGFAMYLVFLDPKTKILFRKRFSLRKPGQLA